MRRITPLGDRVLVEPIKPATTGLICLSDKATTGLVVATGNRVTQVAVGDRVLLPEYTTAELQQGRKLTLLFHEDELLGVVE